MNKNIFKSMGAVLAGLIFIVITHTSTDAILEETASKSVFQFLNDVKS